MEDEKNKIITRYYQDDEIVDLEIDDWLIMNQWGETPAVEEMILITLKICKIQYLTLTRL